MPVIEPLVTLREQRQTSHDVRKRFLKLGHPVTRLQKAANKGHLRITFF